MTPAHLRSQRPALSLSFGTTRVAILDSDYILNQVARLVDDPVRAFSLIGPPFRRGRTFASAHVLSELYQSDKLGFANKWEKLAHQAAERGRSTKPAAYRQMFEQSFLPRITFVDVGGVFVGAEPARRVHAIDRHDAPTGQLAVLLSRTRPIVYAHDKSLWRPGLAPAPANFQAVLRAGFQADNSENLTQGFTYVAGGVIWAVDGAARGVAGVIKVPRWAPWVAVIGVAAWYLVGKERRDRVVDALRPVGQLLQREAEISTNALTTLADAAAQVEPSDRLECRIAEVLAKLSDDEALTAAEIHERITGGFDPPRELPSAGDMRAFMRQLSCFVEGPTSRFRLGHTYETNQ
jgi:hypothetical protein